jgi:hypothetical protein
MYLTCKMDAQGKMTKHASIWGEEEYLGFYVGCCLIFQKLLMVGQENGSLGKKKRTDKLWVLTPSLINISMNKYPH